MKANEIVDVLISFNESSYKRVLINGSWGIGKTKYVSDFIKNHTNVCYISLFGKRDVNSILQELYFLIIEKAPKGKIKKHFSVLRNKLNTLDISYFGVSLSLPVIQNLFKTINKELDRKDKLIIVLDDLERKHDELNIKEILGIVDSLSKTDNIKTVLIAAIDQLEGEDKKNLMNYQEKAIDRTYTIENFASQAPVEIMGNEIWEALCEIAKSNSFDFKNLRTFEKTKLFIEEIIQVLGENIFSEKFTKSDLYKMCFATVLFVTEHNNKMILLQDDKRINDYYKNGGESGEIQYLIDKVLRNSLDNMMCKSVFFHIKKWFENGTFPREEIISSINLVNSYKHKAGIFFSSEEELYSFISYSKTFIAELTGAEKLKDIISLLSNAFEMCKVLSIDYGMKDEDIISLIQKSIINEINIEKNLYENRINLYNIIIKSEKERSLLNAINYTIEREYYDKLLKKIEECLMQGLYNENKYLDIFKESIISDMDESILQRVFQTFRENEFFFSIPKGRITEDHWNWCILIKYVMKDIGKYWNAGFYEEFAAYIESIDCSNDKMLQYRISNYLP
ncbi:P-loop NTPase fold protein [Bacillus subtilis]|uniref:P-loop NTPase fold protein n=1 Tax=Bacillus subtilis TaxID=1423 RepID=UPI0039F6F7E7